MFIISFLVIESTADFAVLCISPLPYSVPAHTRKKMTLSCIWPFPEEGAHKVLYFNYVYGQLNANLTNCCIKALSITKGKMTPCGRLTLSLTNRAEMPPGRSSHHLTIKAWCSSLRLPVNVWPALKPGPMSAWLGGLTAGAALKTPNLTGHRSHILWSPWLVHELLHCEVGTPTEEHTAPDSHQYFLSRTRIFLF